MTAVWRALKRLHGDEGGAEALEKLLIIAAIVLPLVGLLIYFSGELANWVKGLWQQISQAPRQY